MKNEPESAAPERGIRGAVMVSPETVNNLSTVEQGIDSEGIIVIP